MKKQSYDDEIEWQKVDSRVRDGQFWGKWKYDAKRMVLVYYDPDHRNRRYEVDLERCCTASEVLDWITQLSGKGWIGRIDIGYLVQALDELLRLQSNIVHLPGDKRFDVEAHLERSKK